MSFKTKQYRRLDKILNRHDLHIKATGGHNQIIDNTGRRVYTFSSTPKNLHFAEKNTVHDLIKMGLLPKEERL